MVDWGTLGYSQVDDFLPVDVALELEDLFSRERDWFYIDQARDGHYGHVFKTENLYLPGEEETYLAKFKRSDNLLENKRFQWIYDTYFIPVDRDWET